ncbi:gastric inhibitory polypeptide [Engraulis encrasicolus]|uniref:gastric inhibitory polypeptide n=1 Tax=Engraulis encrasicolus TaxID=184585 RepID=UPI002FD2557C
MKSALFVVVALCLGTCKLAEAKALGDEKSLLKDGVHVERRYAESTIASDISKIMDSMVQKNFVNFLLNQREKKSEPLMDPEDEETYDLDFLKKQLSSWVHSKGIRTGAQ